MGGFCSKHSFLTLHYLFWVEWFDFVMRLFLGNKIFNSVFLFYFFNPKFLFQILIKISLVLLEIYGFCNKVYFKEIYFSILVWFLFLFFKSHSSLGEWVIFHAQGRWEDNSHSSLPHELQLLQFSRASIWKGNEFLII